MLWLPRLFLESLSLPCVVCWIELQWDVGEGPWQIVFQRRALHQRLSSLHQLGQGPGTRLLGAMTVILFFVSSTSSYFHCRATPILLVRVSWTGKFDHMGWHHDITIKLLYSAGIIFVRKQLSMNTLISLLSSSIATLLLRFISGRFLSRARSWGLLSLWSITEPRNRDTSAKKTYCS